MRIPKICSLFILAAGWTVLVPIDAAHAQYTCAPGSYSVTGAIDVPNSSYCAPIKDDGYEDDAQSEESPPPEPVWETRWGAIATGEGFFGTALNYSSEQAARDRANSECQTQSNGKPCRVRLAFSNQCASLAAGDTGSIAFSAATEERSKDLATSHCSERTTNCQILYSGCSLPELVN